MYVINPKRYQWVIDMLFGAAVILPIVVFVAGFTSDRALYITIGVCIGYVLHITQKTLVFSDMLERAVENKAEEKVEPEAEKVVRDTVGVSSEDEFESKIEETTESTIQNDAAVQETVEEVVEEKMNDTDQNS